MAEVLRPDICVIGAGSGGLSVAAAAAALRVSVVLVEKGRMGGDCLNYGCVPSKALLAAARRAEAFRRAAPFGIGPASPGPASPGPASPAVDFAKVHAHVRGVIAAVAPNDSRERFTGLGVRVVAGAARFKDRRTVAVGDDIEIRARRVVIATGSSPVLPDIPGLAEAPHFTNETIFDLAECPRHLVVIGGGPSGLELAQAFRRLGARVTVLEAATPLGGDDPECAAIVLRRLAREGITIRSGVRVLRVEAGPPGLPGQPGSPARPANSGAPVRVVIAPAQVPAQVPVPAQGPEHGGPGTADAIETVEGSHLLVAAGRQANVAGLDLEAAGIACDARGIRVDKRLMTTNRKVYAIGDVAGGPKFTHVANYHAGLVIRHALFRLPVDAASGVIPWVTFTDPELAQVGMTARQAAEQHRDIRVLRWPYHDNDRAQAEHETDGHIKVVTARNGRILGATIVGAQAGELITTFTLAIARRLNIRSLAGIVVPYPTLSEIGKRAAISYFTPGLTNPWVQRIIALLRRAR